MSLLFCWGRERSPLSGSGRTARRHPCPRGAARNHGLGYDRRLLGPGLSVMDVVGI